MERHSTPNIPISSSVLSFRSYIPAHSPLTVSSISDLQSSAMDRSGQGSAYRGEVKRQLGPRPVPRFMPRTPGGSTAELEVIGATARAPMMRAHLMGLKTPLVVRSEEGKESQEGDVAIGDLGPLPPVGQALYRSSSPYNPNEVDQSPAILSSSKTSTRSGTPSFDQNQQELQRAQSLSASVSSIIKQAHALEHIKLASTGKVKGGSSLKGSPAWKAQRKLCSSVESASGTSSIPKSALRLNNDAPGSGSSPKRTSWFGSGLTGLGFASTPSSSTNVSTGASTPPVRVSFAKEPVRYSEERE